MIPVLLLKTRSQPHDAYEDFFSNSTSRSREPKGSGPSESEAHVSFLPQFVPVLEHRPNTQNLATLEESLSRGGLRRKYGGMIFTSQRAVEAWGDVVKRVEEHHSSVGCGDEGPDTARETNTRDLGRIGVKEQPESTTTTKSEEPITTTGSSKEHPVVDDDDDFSFPLYTVGPATSRALNTLVTQSGTRPSSPFSRLRPAIFGEHTGNGDKLAQYVLSHYNELHSRRLYASHEAPRLPFTPALGESGGERVEEDDGRFQKKRLLFLVGDKRRDIIPTTLMDRDQKLDPRQRIEVDELEVYITGVMESFQDDFRSRIAEAEKERRSIVVVVVFSPQGCESMLRSLGYLDEEGELTEKAKSRWHGDSGEGQGSREQQCVIVTIGPTTRDHLRNEYGFEPDVCAAKPSPDGVRSGLMEFLRTRRVI